jgi:DNA-binding CsgD family transcriptional regulator
MRLSPSERSVDTGADDVLTSLLETLTILQRVVGYSEGTALAMDPGVVLPIQIATTFPVDPEVARLACRNEQQDTDVLKFRDLARTSPSVGTLSVDHDPACQDSIRWQQLLLPRGRRHELRAALVDAQGLCWGALAVYRHEGVRFTPTNLQATARLVPVRAADLARAMVVSRQPGTPREPASMVIDERGAVLEAPESARRWMDEAGAADPLDRVGMLLASLAARIRGGREAGRDPSPMRVRMRSPGGAWTTLIAESLPGRPAISVVAMATDAAQLLPLQMAAFGLTDRETQVVQTVLEGLDTRAIADRLSISVLTVQDHLKSVFAKTGVHSRRQLATLLIGAPGP